MRKAVIPGSFDPLTNGHLDIIKRASLIFDSVIVLICENPSKKTMFTLDERLEMARIIFKDSPNISVDSTSGLVVQYAKEHSATFIVKGLRDSEDYRYERDLEMNNKFIVPEVETVFLFSKKENISTRSSAIKEFVKYGVDISNFVPQIVWEEIQKKNIF